MKAAMQTPQLNLIAAWMGILLGFGSGLMLGLFFHRENWLGGYASLMRRLYRLAHSSFFGLGAVNLLFYFTVQRLPASPAIVIAAWAFIVGAISMPICCLLMAHFPRAHMFFGVPVLSLLLGGGLTVAVLIQVAHGTDFQPAPTAASPPVTHLSSVLSSEAALAKEEVLLTKEDHTSRITHHVTRLP
jgi:hypothetical protein